MSTCPSTGYLTVGGRMVGLLKCDLVAGHDLPRIGQAAPSSMWAAQTATRTYPGTPHSCTLTWADDEAVDWPEAHDPDEVFDVDVDLMPDLEAALAARLSEVYEARYCPECGRTGTHNIECPTLTVE